MKRGTIEPHKLFKLYKGLYEQRSSGWLHLNHKSGRRKLYFERGCPSLVVSRASQEQLLSRLIKEGICSTSEIAEVERRSREEEVTPETLLIQMRLISEPRLEQALVDLTSEVVWRSLSWRQGEFGWVEERAQLSLSIPVDPITLLGMGGQLVLSAEEKDSIWRRANTSRAQLPRMHPDEERSVSDLIGSESAQALRRGAVINTLALRDDDEGRAALCGLLLSGLLKLSADAQRGGVHQQGQANHPKQMGQPNHEHLTPKPAPAPPRESATPPPPLPTRAVTPPSAPPPRAFKAPQVEFQKAPRVDPQTPRTSTSVTASSQVSVSPTPTPPTPPAGFIDERARVRRPSATATPPEGMRSTAPQGGAHASDPRVERGATRDRRIIKPPENWRRFSINQRESAKPSPSVTPTASHVATSPAVSSVTAAVSATPAPAPKVTPPMSAVASTTASSAVMPTSMPTPPPPPPPPSAPTPVQTAVAPSMTPPPPSAPSPMPTAVTPSITPSPSPSAGRTPKVAGQRQTKRAKKQPPAKIQARVDRLIELYHKCEELNHYELLDLESDVDTPQLGRVFKKLVAHLHIDQYLRFDFSEETLDQLKQLFIMVNRAYQVLNDPEQRREYDLTLSLGGDQAGSQETTPQRDLGQLLRAEQLTREAINFVKRGKLELAQEKIEEALSINTNDPLSESVKIYIDGQRAKSGGASVAVLRTFIDRLEALVLTYEGREEPFLYLGILYSYCQEYKRGVRALERALEINPHFAEASSQLRHLQRLASDGGDAKRSGLFKRR